MATFALPLPKLASTTGANTVASLVIWLLTVAVATTISASSGSDTVGWNGLSCAPGTPWAWSTWHISGSQPTISLGATQRRTQAAAWLRAVAAAARPGSAGPLWRTLWRMLWRMLWWMIFGAAMAEAMTTTPTTDA